MKIEHISRAAIDSEAWNGCVASSPNRIIYGYSWYLDAVTNLTNWKWAGLVMSNQSGNYVAVMPVPLRRKYGIWVVHQPLFCQFLGVFGAKLTPDLEDDFAQALLKCYWYGSIFHLRLPEKNSLFRAMPFTANRCHTHLLDLDQSYETIHQHYSSDTRRHLRQAQSAPWCVQEFADPAPLFALFRQHHAQQIPGGVGEWAYDLFGNLLRELQKRGLATLRYAVQEGKIEAGAIFIETDNRIIYLFNAASETGRRDHARTLLIDQIIREQAGRKEVLFDFESPSNQSVARFYQEFGATASPFWAVRWSRLPWLMRVGRSLTYRHALAKLRGRF